MLSGATMFIPDSSEEEEREERRDASHATAVGGSPTVTGWRGVAAADL